MARITICHFIVISSVLIQVAICGWKIDELKRILKSKFRGTPKLIPGPIVKGCNLCVWGTCTPAIKGAPGNVFSAQADAEELKKALDRPLWVKKDPVVSIMTSRSESQRQEIGMAYKAKTTINLSARIIDYITPSYRRTGFLLSMLSLPIQDFYSYRIYKLIQLLPNSDQKDRINMIEIFTTLSPCLIRKISQSYNEKYGKGKLAEDIERTLKNQFSQTDYIDVIQSMAKGNRDDVLQTSLFRAWKDASRMKAAILSENWEQKKEIFKDIFTGRSITQLRETIRLYEKMRGNDNGFTSLQFDIEKGLESAKEIYGTMVKIIKDQPNYFADLLEKTIDSNKDYDEDNFVFLIRGRCDIDLEDIKKAYEKKYRRDLFTKFSIRDKGRGGPFYVSMKNILDTSTTGN